MSETPVSPRPAALRRARWIAVLLVVMAALAAQGCSVQMPWAQKEEEAPLALPAYQPTQGESAPAAQEAAPAAAEPAAKDRKSVV